MIDFTIRTEIERPVADVFAYATDPEKLASWQTNTVSVTREDDGEYGLGSRLHEVHAGPRGKHFESVVEVSEYEPDRTFALRLVEGQLPIHAHITFEPAGDGTLMHFRVHGQPTGATRPHGAPPAAGPEEAVHRLLPEPRAPARERARSRLGHYRCHD